MHLSGAGSFRVVLAGTDGQEEIVTAGPTDQSYTHVDEDVGACWHFFVPKLIALRRPDMLADIAIDPDYVWYVMGRSENRVDPARVRWLIGPGRQYLREPVLYVQAPADGSWLLVDGIHRYVGLSSIGETTVRGYMFVDPKDWQPAVIKGMHFPGGKYIPAGMEEARQLAQAAHRPIPG